MSDLPPPPPPPPPGSGGFPSGPPTGPATGPPVTPAAEDAAGGPWVVPGGGAPPPPDDPASEAPGDGRRRTLLVVAGVIGVLVLLVASIAFLGDDEPSRPDAAPTTEGPRDATTTAPSSTTEPPDEATTAEFEALMDELEAYVAEARGLEFERDVEVELADDAEFESRLLENFEEDLPEIEDTEVAFRALGLLEPGVSLIDTLKGIYAEGVLGYYDPETDELVVRGRATTPYVQQTIVHELVHALDDQHFELHRPQYDEAEDEIAVGFSAVVEGNARRIENQWLGEQPSDFREQAREEEEAFGAGLDLSGFPEILLVLIGAPYELGEVLVGDRITRGGERAVDAALTEPPDTSEQVLFPELFQERQPRIEVPPPPADGEVIDEGVVGALFLFALLTTGGSAVNQSDAFRAVEGWGGDWAVTWTTDELACMRADFVGDTEGDTEEIRTALTRWAEDREGPQVSTVEGRVRLESCAASAGAAPPQV